MMKVNLQVRVTMMLMKMREGFHRVEMLSETTGFKFKQCPIEERMQGLETEKKVSY